MNCQYLIGICSKTRLPCPHCQVSGQCDEAECSNAVVPSWNELIDIYEVAMKPTHRRLSTIRTMLKAFTAALGTDLGAKVAVTDEQIDAAYSALLADHSPYTVDSIFASVKACTSRRREIKMEYRRRTKQIPEMDFPEVKKEMKPIVQLTEAQRLAIREEMTKRRTSGKPSDRSRFLWLWLQHTFGIRPKDVGELKWNAFRVRSDGSMWLDYVPTKTSKKCVGRRAGCKLTEEQIEMVRPFIGNPDDHIIPRYANRKPKSGCVRTSHGEYCGHHLSLRKYVIGFMRSIGVDDPKPQYANRKDCAQRTIREHGLLHESQMLGHTPKVALSNYADISKINLKEGL